MSKIHSCRGFFETQCRKKIRIEFVEYDVVYKPTVVFLDFLRHSVEKKSESSSWNTTLCTSQLLFSC